MCAACKGRGGNKSEANTPVTIVCGSMEDVGALKKTLANFTCVCETETADCCASLEGEI